MRIRFPFAEADDARCRMYEQRSAKYKKKGSDPFGASFAHLYARLATQCYADVKKQNPEPPVWSSVCEAAGMSYAQAFAGESLKLIGAVGRLKQQGCVAADPDTAKANGLLLTCSTPEGFWACRAEFPLDGAKHCRGVTAVASTSTKATVQAAAGGPVLGAVQAAAAGQPQAEARSQEGGAPPSGAVRAAAAVLRASQVDVEAETLIAAAKIQIRGGHVADQAMTGFGPGWGGGAQLFWGGGAVGGTLDLIVDIPLDGAWTAEVLLTRAPDYGQLQFEVDQHPVTARFDGYAPRVAGPVTVQLGTFTLQAGPRRVSLMIIGKNGQSTGWLAGVDRVRLRRVGAQ
jgi:hypothetical protein